MYPRLLRRVRAFLIDTTIFAILLYAWMISLPFVEGTTLLVKIGLLVVPLFIVDPGLVALTGGSPGHHMMGLRVRDAAHDRNIGILRSLARTLIRTSLGWLSFVFVLVTRRHQALHDYFTSTVVVLRDPESLPAFERFVARTEDGARYRYPSKLRRVVMIFFYVVLEFAVLSALMAALLPERCLNHQRCTTGEFMVSGVLELLALVCFGAIVILGWRGLLYGCRRKALTQNVAPNS
jgi:uncharacterized RDD family membrane protein YckC